MDYTQYLRERLIEVRDLYYAAKNNYQAAKTGQKPDFIKESTELLRQEKQALGHLLRVVEEKCDLYGVDKK